MPCCSQVRGAARFEGQCLHPEGEQRHQNAPKWVPLRGEGKGGGMGRVPTGCVAAAGNSMRKNRSPPHPRAHFAKRKNALVQGLGETARRLLGPRQGTTGFFGPAAEAKRQHPPTTYPGDGVGMGIACLPLTQGSPQSPKTKNTTEQTNKNKNKKHCYHQLI